MKEEQTLKNIFALPVDELTEVALTGNKLEFTYKSVAMVLDNSDDLISLSVFGIDVLTYTRLNQEYALFRRRIVDHFAELCNEQLGSDLIVKGVTDE